MNTINSVHAAGARGVIQTITNRIPNAPTSLAYIASSATTSSVRVSFTPPNNVAITSVYTPSSGTGSGTASNYTVSGLSSNTSYSLTIKANSLFGKVGTASSALSVLTLPAAPTIGTATISTTTASVAFTAPGGTGTITSYTVTSSPGSLTGTGSTSPISVTGLTTGTAYTFTVTATNASGTSVASSASNSVNTVYDGLSSANAAPSAAYLVANGNTTNGVYWINLPTVGATQIYCILDRAVDGGGWMMAMKATRGTTFNYYASDWTTVTTLNPTDTTRNDADAKYHTMNYSPATDILGLWPDISYNNPNGGSLSLPSYNCWTWLQNGFTSAGTYYNTGNNPATVSVSGITTSMTLISWFNTLQSATVTTGTNGAKCFIQDAKTWSGWKGSIFTSQKDVRFYGFNYYNNQDNTNGTRTRWGFGWNENGDYNGQNQGTALSLFPKGEMGSDDVFGGIGTWGVQQTNAATYHYSAGDGLGCCQDNTGINRSARIEIYIRNSASAPSAPTIGTVTNSGSTVTVPFTTVAGASYYTAFSNTGGFYGSSTTSPITITGVTGGTYTFTVKASSASGTSLASAASNSVTINGATFTPSGTYSTNSLNGKTIVTSTTTYTGYIFTAGSTNTLAITNVTGSVTFYALIVGGGGSAAASESGGGGAGGFLQKTYTVTGNDTLTIAVGANDANSSITFANTTSYNTGNVAFAGGKGVQSSQGTTGGSGGGTGRDSTAAGAAGTAGQGNAGGTNTSVGWAGASGGGGAGAVGGGSGTNLTGGVGGAGLACTLTGFNQTIFFAGGGGGAQNSGGVTTGGSGGNGGKGGGGGGGSQNGSSYGFVGGTGDTNSFYSAGNGSNAAAGTGGNGATNSGGGAGGSQNGTASTGGSGVVIIVVVN